MAGHRDTVVSRCRVYDDPQAGSQTVPVSATWESPCCLRQVAVEPCFAFKLQAMLSSAVHNPSLSPALFWSTRQNKELLYLKLHTSWLQPCLLFLVPSVPRWSAAPASVLIFGKRPLSVINVRCVAVYVSNHNSSMKSALPGSDRHACVHTATQRLLLYKADFKYSHFRGDALQWHEASRSTALSLFSLPHTLSASACIPSVLLWQGTASHGLNTNAIISWQSPFICLLSLW